MNSLNFSFSTLEDTRLGDSARHLAELLGQTAQYARFIELSRTVNLDPQVTALLRQIRARRSFYARPEPADGGRDLQAELEALPVMLDFRQAERELRALVGAVDQAIGSAAGMNFAINVPESGCG
jgi:cell fate (sporulation/competence/biofilm development) regulator YlbF (YheA/YmcA/DUF963 family)